MLCPPVSTAAGEFLTREVWPQMPKTVCVGMWLTCHRPHQMCNAFDHVYDDAHDDAHYDAHDDAHDDAHNDARWLSVVGV